MKTQRNPNKQILPWTQIVHGQGLHGKGIWGLCCGCSCKNAEP